jgi:hypothetical protein
MPSIGTDRDDLEELPPLDGEEGEAGAENESLEGSVDPAPDGQGLDDEVAGDDVDGDEEVAANEGEATWLDGEQDAADLDLGAAPDALVDAETEMSAADDASAEYEADADMSEEPAHLLTDGGDEGPVAPDEELRDDDLPALDADDEGEAAEDAFVDARFAADEPLGLPWAARPWPRVGAPVQVTGATAVACAGRGALVALRARPAPEGTPIGAELVQVDLEGMCRTLTEVPAGDVDSLSSDGTGQGSVALVAVRQLLTSRDGGGTFAIDREVPEAAECVVAHDGLWVRTREGALLTRDGPTLTNRALPGFVRAVASDGAGGVVALVLHGRQPTLARFRRDGSIEVSSAQADDGPLLPLTGAGSNAVLVTARGELAAYGVANTVVRRGSDGQWRTFGGWEGRATAMTFVDDTGTLLVAVYSDADDSTGLIRVDADGGRAVVARIGAAREIDSDGQTLSMACDDGHGVVWLAGGFGIAAFSIVGG